jgi:predicted outer membrane protein
MAPSRRACSCLLTLAFAALVPACASQARGTRTSTTPPMTPAAGPVVQRLSEDQMWRVLETINDVELTAARAALPRAEDARVRAFAEHMIQSHRDEARTERDATARLDVRNASSALSTQIASEADDDVRTIQELPRAQIDRWYIAMQLRAHQHTLDVIDNQLLAQAHSPELRAELLAMRAREFEHFIEARRIEMELGPQ